jgi:hypothetical protein
MSSFRGHPCRQRENEYRRLASKMAVPQAKLKDGASLCESVFADAPFEKVPTEIELIAAVLSPT